MGFFVFYIKTFRADFLMLIKFFNETTVIMYRRESSRRTETKKLFIKLAANGRETDWLRGIFPLILSQPLS